MQLVGEHPQLGSLAALAFLPADFLDSRLFGGDPAGAQLFNFVEQELAGEKAIEALLARRLAFYLNTGGTMDQHDAG